MKSWMTRFFLPILIVGLTANLTLAWEYDVRWRMDDGVGLEIVDSSGNKNNGRASSIRWSAGVHSSAIQINRGGIVDCGNGDSLNITDTLSIDSLAGDVARIIQPNQKDQKWEIGQ